MQDLPDSGISYFTILGLDESINLNEDVLREKFYTLSKKTHPDMFLNVPPPESLYSLKWSAAVNRAYQTLRDRHLRSVYLLQLYKLNKNKGREVPVELAETYFELQDLLMDDKEKEGQSKIEKFKQSLITQLDLIDVDWQNIASQWEKADDKTSVLHALMSNLNNQNYLNSMLADIDRRLGKNSNDHWN